MKYIIVGLVLICTSCKFYPEKKIKAKSVKVRSCLNSYIQSLDTNIVEQLKSSFHNYYDSINGINEMDISELIMFSKNKDSLFLIYYDKEYLSNSNYHKFHLASGFLKKDFNNWTFKQSVGTYFTPTEVKSFEKAKLDLEMFLALQGYINSSCEVNHKYVESLLKRNL